MAIGKAGSSRTWGREKEKSRDQVVAEYDAFFGKLKIPDHWKFVGNVHVIENDIIFTLGRLYKDMHTQGKGLKHYRVFWNAFSDRGGIVEKFFIDFGDEKKTCLVWNKTAEQLNEFIAVKMTGEKEDEVDNDSEDKMDNLRKLIEGL